MVYIFIYTHVYMKTQVATIWNYCYTPIAETTTSVTTSCVTDQKSQLSPALTA